MGEYCKLEEAVYVETLADSNMLSSPTTKVFLRIRDEPLGLKSC